MSDPMPKRRRFLVNGPLQIKYAVMIGVVLLIMLILVQFHTYWTIQSIFPHIFSSLIGRQIQALQYWLLINGLVYAAGAAFLSIFISHKIAGPAYRLERDIQGILDTGDFTRRIHLREGDELHSLAEKVNSLLERLGQFQRK